MNTTQGLNWKEIDLLLQESTLSGSHIQKIRQPDFHTLLLDLYQPSHGRTTFMISLHPRFYRFHALSQPPLKTSGKTDRLQRFAQFLRARVSGGRILDARQLGRERIVELSVRTGEELTKIYVRLWGGASNILVTDEAGTVLDAFYRRPNRGEISGESFDPGVSVRSESKSDYAIRPYPSDRSFTAVIESMYRTAEAIEYRDMLQAKASHRIEQQIERLTVTLARLHERLASCDSAETFRETADLLAANLYAVRPRMSWIEVSSFTEPDERVMIALDPTKSPGANVESYYTRYRKAHTEKEHLLEEMRNIENQLTLRREQARSLLDLSSDPEEDISRLTEFLASQESEKPRPGTPETERQPGLQYTSGQFTLFVGRNAKENDALLRSYTRGNDLWLHTRDVPGGYVIIKHQQGKSIPLEVLLDAGNLALFYSKARESGKADLYYTQVKYLRRVRQGKTGSVIPTQEKNLTIELDRARLDRLFEEV